MKTFLLIFAIMSSPMQEPNWDYVTMDKMTGKECAGHIKELLDNTKFSYFDRDAKAAFFKLPSNDTLVLTCFDTTRRTHVNHN